MKIFSTIVWLCLMVFLGVAAAQLLLDLIAGQSLEPTLIPKCSLIALIGAGASAGLLVWVAKTRYTFGLELMRCIFVFILLVPAGGAFGAGLWGACRAPEFLESDDPAQDAIVSKKAADAKREYQNDLSTEVVRCDQTLGLAALKSALRGNPGRNEIVFPPGLAQILHIDVALGDARTKSEICRASGLSEFPKGLSKADKAVRELIGHADPGVSIKWNTTIELPASGVAPSSLLQQLSDDYCGRGIVRNGSLQSGDSLFKTVAEFNGKWKYKFDGTNTSRGDFFALSHPYSIDFMHKNFSHDEQVYYFQYPTGTVVGLPYKNDQQVAYIILPDKSTTLAKFIERTTPSELSTMTQPGNSSAGDLALPKLSIELSEKLNKVLRDMGISHLFDGSNSLPQLAANGATSAVSIQQQVSLSLDEKGTKVSVILEQLNHTSAAAGMAPEPFKVKVDRPFMLVIKDERTGEWLFLGAIFDPIGEKA